ncbi:MAG TPA: ribonuclease Z [Candidatus Marinimicrobia bacterium]|nr:ribonuclease Z [Candidatus Neomarinimicrobiota bacterium]
MKLTVLGSGYFIPTKKRNNSGYLLQIDNENLLLDSGPGVLRQLIKTGYSVWDISKIFYSHLHIDHLADLLPILFIRKYSQPQERNSELSIYSHQDLNRVITGYEGLFGRWILNEKHPYRFHSLESGRSTFEHFSLRVYQAVHTEQSLMYRFEDAKGTSLLYTGDTELSAALIEAAEGVDVLVTEFSSIDEDPKPGHLSPAKISFLLDKCRPKLTILSHLTPETEQRAVIAQIKIPPNCVVEAAEDLKTWEF